MNFPTNSDLKPQNQTCLYNNTQLNKLYSRQNGFDQNYTNGWNPLLYSNSLIQIDNTPQAINENIINGRNVHAATASIEAQRSISFNYLFDSALLQTSNEIYCQQMNGALLPTNQTTTYQSAENYTAREMPGTNIQARRVQANPTSDDCWEEIEKVVPKGIMGQLTIELLELQQIVAEQHNSIMLAVCVLNLHLGALRSNRTSTHQASSIPKSRNSGLSSPSKEVDQSLIIRINSLALNDLTNHTTRAQPSLTYCKLVEERTREQQENAKKRCHKTEMCKLFQKGKCNKADNCGFGELLTVLVNIFVLK